MTDTQRSQAAAPKTENVVNYMALPSPIKYEELQREAMRASPPCRHLAVDETDTLRAVHEINRPLRIMAWLIIVHPFAEVLKPEVFEGLRFDFNKPLNQNFALCHRYALCPVPWSLKP